MQNPQSKCKLEADCEPPKPEPSQLAKSSKTSTTTTCIVLSSAQPWTTIEEDVLLLGLCFQQVLWYSLLMAAASLSTFKTLKQRSILRCSKQIREQKSRIYIIWRCTMFLICSHD
ncbi:hypothetical protein SSX86_026876 [Deinandra increscens subsp. villosa]|uniref:Uncharacterized protein n=1 Tax=Deinandra increscens subsp. villosa TaxID=3103831 RepID=A0AAP0CGR6_9ASTR